MWGASSEAAERGEALQEQCDRIGLACVHIDGKGTDTKNFVRRGAFASRSIIKTSIGILISRLSSALTFLKLVRFMVNSLIEGLFDATRRLRLTFALEQCNEFPNRRYDPPLSQRFSGINSATRSRWFVWYGSLLADTESPPNLRD